MPPTLTALYDEVDALAQGKPSAGLQARDAIGSAGSLRE
jgi:hypothetical protein